MRWGVVLAGVLTVGLWSEQQGRVRQILANHRLPFQTLRGQLQAAQEQLADKLYGAGSSSPRIGRR